MSLIAPPDTARESGVSPYSPLTSWVGSTVQQEYHRRRIRIGGGHQQRRQRTGRGRGVGIGAALEQQARGPGLPPVDGVLQRRPAGRQAVAVVDPPRRHRAARRFASRAPRRAAQMTASTDRTSRRVRWLSLNSRGSRQRRWRRRRW